MINRTETTMSIFFKFGVELGEPQNVTCDGMDMSLGDLKLAIKDQRKIKNVTDFDLQVIFRHLLDYSLLLSILLG